MVTLEERLANIEKYASYKNDLEKWYGENILKEWTTLETSIGELGDRITAMIAVANACIEAGIELDFYGMMGLHCDEHDTYQRGTFISNSCSHRLGFMRKENTRITHIGIYGRHKNSYGDLYINADELVFCHRESGEPIPKETAVLEENIEMLRKVLRYFAEFEKFFYAYVDCLTLIVEK